MVDYPSTSQEALTLATYSNALNGVFEVNETKVADDKQSEQNESENDANEDEEESEDQDKQEAASNKEAQNAAKNATPDSPEEQAAQKKIVTELYKARKISAKNSPLRQMAFIKMNFVDEEV